MNLPHDLEAFLDTLRTAHIPVGQREIIWLHHVFQQTPRLDEDALKAMLRSLLAKTPKQQERFDTLFELWLSKTEEARPKAASSELSKAPVRPDQGPASDDTATSSTQIQSRKRRVWPIWTAVALTILIGLLVVLWLYPLSEPAETIPTDSLDLTATDTGEAEQALPSDPVSHYWTWVPSVGGTERPITPLYPLLGFALFAPVLAGLLWWRYKRNARLPKGLEAPSPGPRWLPLLGMDSAGPELLTPEAVRGAVWSVGRFVSDDLTDRLDLQKTVEATARAAGVPVLHREKAVYDREVWLWLDERCDKPGMVRQAQELQQALAFTSSPRRIAVSMANAMTGLTCGLHSVSSLRSSSLFKRLERLLLDGNVRVAWMISMAMRIQVGPK